MKRVFLWVVSNADTLIALIIAVLVSILGVIGVASSTVVANATVATLAVLAYTILHDRKLQEGTRELVQNMEEKFDSKNPVRYLTGRAINRAIVEAFNNTDQWFFRGSTATYVRVMIIPECIRRARQEGKEFRVRLEILDPANTAACESYIRIYRSNTEDPHGPEMSWTVDGTRIELYATILAACWYKQRYEPFTVEIGLTEKATSFRWEASSHHFILTLKGPHFPAMLIDEKEPFYRLLVAELNASFRQARKLPLELAGSVELSNEPTSREVRDLFSAIQLELPPHFGDKEILEIVNKALRDEDPYKGVNP